MLLPTTASISSAICLPHSHHSLPPLICLSICLSVCLPVCLPVCLILACQSIHLPNPPPPPPSPSPLPLPLPPSPQRCVVEGVESVVVGCSDVRPSLQQKPYHVISLLGDGIVQWSVSLRVLRRGREGGRGGEGGREGGREGGEGG